MMAKNEKLERLEGYLANLEKLAVAFSGGVDSTFLLKVAHMILGDNVVAITVNGAIHPGWEIESSKEIASRIGVRQILLDMDIFKNENIVTNPPDRCYHCKMAIFSMIKKTAKGYGIDNVADGSNIDDAGDYRPGMRALKELGILSPLRDAGLGKEEIRILSKELGLPTWDKPALSCLATRIPYNTRITEETLSMIEAGEDFLRGLGFSQIRLRHLGNLAKIEVPPEDMMRLLGLREMVVKKLREIGYTYITMDMEGYNMGSMNRTIKGE
ncbi:MAG TPA: ATP-dependent sacrificial sulfur transferase LarE [bacterium]|nr:ATP-dependent sacrificial sulfur transferase LarE [bacterium]